MKKLFTSALFAFAIFASSLTVSASNDLQVSAQATAFARQLVNVAQLNEMEYIKVKSLTAEKLGKIAEIQVMYSNDPTMLASKTAEAENNYLHNIQAVLNAGQFEKYVAFTAKPSGSAVAVTQE